MKLYVKRCKRKFNKTNTNYKDIWVAVGTKDVTLSGHGDNTIVHLNGRELKGVFGLKITSRYIEFCGFDYKNPMKNEQGITVGPDYVHLRCFQLSCDRPHDD